MRIWVSELTDFVGRHWGDFAGGFLLVVGVVLLVLYACKTGDWAEVKTIAVGLVLAATSILKLRSIPKNGSGNGGTPVA